MGFKKHPFPSYHWFLVPKSTSLPLQGGRHKVTKAAKDAVSPTKKKAENCMNCSTHPRGCPPSRTELGPDKMFSAQNPKNSKKFSSFPGQKGGGHFFSPPKDPQPPTRLPLLAIYEIGSTGYFSAQT